jgi:hypothetical protein
MIGGWFDKLNVLLQALLLETDVDHTEGETIFSSFFRKRKEKL